MKAFFFLFMLTVSAWAQTPQPLVSPLGPPGLMNDQALFLAGMPVPPSSPLAPFTRSGAWQRHSQELDAQWLTMERGRLQVAQNWSLTEVQPRLERPNTLFYFFGGPDFLWANAMFPDANTYVLAGLEPLGQVPAIPSMPSRALGQSLVQLRTTLKSNLEKGFFETKEMREHFQLEGAHGVAPVLAFFLARTDHRILRSRYLLLSPAGEPQATHDPGRATGMAIEFVPREGGSPMTLYYFNTDISDSALRRDDRFLKFCHRQTPGGSYLKAASYLMHGPDFSLARSFLLNQSEFILQDDSGIPLHYFDPAQWNLFFYGSYRPVEIFQKHYQPALAEIYRSGRAAQLPFGTGYRVRDEDANQMLAIRR